MRQPEHGLGGIPEGNNVLRRASKKEAQGREGAVEPGAGGFESLFYTRKRTGQYLVVGIKGDV